MRRKQVADEQGCGCFIVSSSSEPLQNTNSVHFVTTRDACTPVTFMNRDKKTMRSNHNVTTKDFHWH
jgi:hypothetical protein